MTIPKNRDSSGTPILYIVGTSVFISSAQRQRSPATALGARGRLVQRMLGASRISTPLFPALLRELKPCWLCVDSFQEDTCEIQEVLGITDR